MSWSNKIKAFAKKVKTEIVALSIALRDKRTPVLAKILVFITLSYALSPIDLIPDFIPILGYLDDAVILPLLIMLTIRLIPSQVMTDCRNKVASNPEINRRFGWIAAVVIVLIWLLLLMLILRWFEIL